MRRWILLSFLTGALLALVVVSTQHGGRKTAVVTKPAHPVVKPASLQAANIPPEAAEPEAPITVESHSVVRTHHEPAAQTSGTAARSLDGPRIRMERDPSTGELRPCLEAPARTAAAADPLPTPPQLVAAMTPVPTAMALRAAAPAPRFATMVIKEGTVIPVRLDAALSSHSSRIGEHFSAITDEPITVDGQTVIPAGARTEGQIVEVSHAGPLRGLARLSIVLTELVAADGQQLAIDTLPLEANGRNLPVLQQARTTASALVGGSVGMVAGKSAGSAAGGMVKDLVGTTGALVTGGRTVVLRPNTPLRFRLLRAVTVTAAL